MTSAVEALRLDGIGKQLGYLPVLTDVTASVAAGSLVALLGRNGAGKTTLLRIVATILHPTAGEGWILGNSLLHARDQVRRLVGYLGHGSGLYDGMTAVENLWLTGRLFGMADIASKVDRAIASAGLEDYRDVSVRTFSKGMVRRLALERVMLPGPELMLLDEPFDGLDPQSQARLAQRLVEHRKQGHTALIVTHDVEQARALCDRALVLGQGRIIRDVAGGSLERGMVAPS